MDIGKWHLASTVVNVLIAGAKTCANWTGETVAGKQGFIERAIAWTEFGIKRSKDCVGVRFGLMCVSDSCWCNCECLLFAGNNERRIFFAGIV